MKNFYLFKTSTCNLILISLFVFSSYTVEGDTGQKLWDLLPREIKRQIVVQAFLESGADVNGKRLSPQMFYNDFKKWININPKLLLHFIKNTIRRKGLRDLYFPNEVLNDEANKWMAQCALSIATKENRLDIAEVFRAEHIYPNLSK